MKIKRVIQEDSTGCGIACIAMVAESHMPKLNKLL